VPGTTDQRYWDSATCLAYLLDEAGRADACQLVLDAAEDGKLELVISTLTIAEVLALRGKAALAQDDPNPRVRVHLAYIRPDVQRGEAEAKFWLRPVRLATSDGFTTRQLARIEAIVRAHRAEFVRTWETYFRDYPDQHQPER
jgi:predicted nucleic acid-binding protein